MVVARPPRRLTSFLTFLMVTVIVCVVFYKTGSKYITTNINLTSDVLSVNEEFDQFEMKYINLTRQPDTAVELKPNMTLNQTDYLFFAFLSHLHYTCKDWRRMGNAADGGWSVCMVGPYGIRKPCLVYSFGINNDWSFDDAITNAYGCKVRAFDPSMNVQDHVRGTNIYFYKIGFAGSDRNATNNWVMRTFSTLVRNFNDTGVMIDYLKFDVELSEWEVLESFISRPEDQFLLKYRVKQLALEIHTDLHPGPARSPTAEVLYKRWLTLRPLETTLGYRRWWFTINPYSAYNYAGQRRSLAYEMVYINRRFLMPRSQRSWFL